MRLTLIFIVLLISFPAHAKTLFTSWSQLTLVGGFKVPVATIDGYNSRYTSGSFDKRPGTSYWIAHHGASQYIVEYIEPGQPDMTFPYLIVGRHGSPFTSVDKISATGVQWVDADNVICSGRKSYRTGATYNWVSLWNLATGVEALQTVGNVDASSNWSEGSSDNHLFHLHNAFGSGFTRIPSDWAATYVGGRTIGMAAGGYDVLNSPMGPAVAAFAVGDTLPVTLMDYPLSFTSSDGNTHYEIRDTNYSFPVYGGTGGTPLPLWTPPGIGMISSNPPLSGPTGSHGYMVADGVSHGAGWIDDVLYKGVVFGVISPNGYIDYNAQGNDGSGQMFLVSDPTIFYDGVPAEQVDCNDTDNRGCHSGYTEYANGPKGSYSHRLYTYDPDCLAQVATKTKKEWECSPTIIAPDFSNLPFTLSQNAKEPSKIAGVTWDADRGYLWLTITQAHTDNKYAILVAYKLASTPIKSTSAPTIFGIKLQ